MRAVEIELELMKLGWIVQRKACHGLPRLDGTNQ